MTPETEQNGAALEAPRPGTVAPSIAPATVPILTPEIIEAAKRIIAARGAWTMPEGDWIEKDAVIVARYVAALSQPGEAAERIARDLSWSYPSGDNSKADREQLAAEIAQALTRHAAERDAEIVRLKNELRDAKAWNGLYDREPNERRKKAIALRAAKWEMGCACQFDEDGETLIIECSYHMDARKTAGAERDARVRELEAAISWALGEIDDFPERQPGQGAYWWRSELRRRALGGSK